MASGLEINRVYRIVNFIRVWNRNRVFFFFFLLRIYCVIHTGSFCYLSAACYLTTQKPPGRMRWSVMGFRVIKDLKRCHFKVCVKSRKAPGTQAVNSELLRFTLNLTAFVHRRLKKKKKTTWLYLWVLILCTMELQTGLALGLDQDSSVCGMLHWQGRWDCTLIIQTRKSRFCPNATLKINLSPNVNFSPFQTRMRVPLLGKRKNIHTIFINAHIDKSLMLPLMFHPNSLNILCIHYLS